jgi:hypothetical protein
MEYTISENRNNFEGASCSVANTNIKKAEEKTENKVKFIYEQNVDASASTFCSGTYSVFEKTGDTSVFDKDVIKSIIDEYGVNEDAETIEHISDIKDIKRQILAILLLLDKHSNKYKWKELRELIENGHDFKSENLLLVIKMFREFVPMLPVDKKKSGEVMTPVDLVIEMLDTMPADFWKNPNHKILDSCAGIGVFLVICIFKLMEGLKEWEPDEEKRFRHIIENMIYYGELRNRNYFLWLCIINIGLKYKSSSYWGDFLSKNFDKHMENVWKIKKFNLAIGNPPYNDESSSKLKTTNQSKNKIWMEFVEKSLSISEYVLFVSPNNWLGKTCYLKNLFKNSVVLAQIDSDMLKEKYFPKIGSTFSYYLLNKTPKNTVYYLGENKIDMNILELDILPTKNIDIISFNIFKKIQNNKNFKKLKFNRTDKNQCKLTNLDLCIYIDRSKNKGFSKADDAIYNTSSYWYVCSDKNEMDILLFNLNTKLYKFLIKNIRSGMAIVSIINDLPICMEKIDFEKSIFDEEEIEYINKNIK